jgi:hypothetical protein
VVLTSSLGSGSAALLNALLRLLLMRVSGVMKDFVREIRSAGSADLYALVLDFSYAP